jgi:hypothetical protein
MPNVYIEARPMGRPQGDPIDDYVVRIAIMSSLRSRNAGAGNRMGTQTGAPAISRAGTASQR